MQREKRLRNIISGRTPILLYLEFLHSHNHADLVLLKNAKAAVEARNSVCHSALVFANALMHSGTTADTFLRNNLDWLSRATNWAKFGATAGLGVIHRGHLTQVGFLENPQHDICTANLVTWCACCLACRACLCPGHLCQLETAGRMLGVPAPSIRSMQGPKSMLYV